MLPPKPLSPVAMERWGQLAAEVDPSQADLLAVYCEAYSDWREASEKVTSGGRLVKNAKGKVMPSPWLAIRDHAALVMERLGATLMISMSADVLQARPGNEPIDGITVEMAIAALRAGGGSVKQASERLKISRRTFGRKFEVLGEVKEAISEIRAELLDLSEGVMLSLIKKGDREAARFYLRCFGKERGWVESTRLEGSGGGPIVIKIDKEDEDL